VGDVLVTKHHSRGQDVLLVAGGVLMVAGTLVLLLATVLYLATLDTDFLVAVRYAAATAIVGVVLQAVEWLWRRW
jgi:chromate transport protein ChrA